MQYHKSHEHTDGKPTLDTRNQFRHLLTNNKMQFKYNFSTHSNASKKETTFYWSHRFVDNKNAK